MGRQRLLTELRDTHIDAFLMQHDADPEKVKLIVQDIIKERLHRPSIVNEVSSGSSSYYTKQEDFIDFIDKNANNLITPSGSIYYNDRNPSVLCQYVQDKKQFRKKAKAQMLKCAAEQDELGEAIAYATQTSAKINLNSVPGAFGALGNFLSDKGNYNAITSSCRTLIAYSYTTAEELLAGNFALYKKHHVINHMRLLKKYCPSATVINSCINKFGLYVPTREDLFEFFLDTLHNYSRMRDVEWLHNLINRLQQHEVVFMYYYNNLHHLLRKNTAMAKDLLKRSVCKDTLDTTGIQGTTDEIYSLDGDLAILVAIIMREEIKVKHFSKLPESQPEVAKRYIAMARQLKCGIDRLNEIMNVFVYTDVPFQSINTKREMIRKAVPVSDTDSVIFTVKDWVEWYTGSIFGFDNQEAYDVAAFMVYQLTKVNEHSLYKHSATIGVREANRRIMSMKNEFAFLVLMVYPTKKTYASLMAIQEGVFFDEPQLDLKGLALRSSELCDDAAAAVETFIKDTILGRVMKGGLDCNEIIQDVVKYERKIYDTCMAGDGKYLKIVAIKIDDDYKDVRHTQGYAKAWDFIFKGVEEAITPPAKVKVVQLRKKGITKEYLSWLSSKYPKIHKNLKAYLDEYGKLPTYICINSEKIPEALIPLINIREIIHFCCKPMYLTLARVNIHLGLMKKSLLMSDVYGEPLDV